jgi:hypothetical protein
MRAWLTVLGGCVMSASALACGAAESGLGTEPPPQQQVGKHSEAFSFPRLDKVDLLFVVDNSNSMAGEQAQLRAQFPRLMEALTLGQLSPDDPRTFTPVRDMHVGVVSTDMGIPGVELPPSCHADGGDDGRLQNAPHPEAGLTCDAAYPRFLDYQSSSSDAPKLAQDFACIATLGTGGCGFESQLEAPFKALVPRVFVGEGGQPLPTPFRFIATEEARTWGRGDLAAQYGGNLGFLRDDPDDPSLLVIVLLSDEEDCSVSSTDHLKPNNQLPESGPGSEYRLEDINLRCHDHPEFLYDLKSRYLDGFRALRPGRQDLVVFSAIVGVPADLVSADVMANTNFDDDSAREAFYDKIMQDARMQDEVDPSTMPGSGQGNLKPSCLRVQRGETSPSTAYPPRRIVELARAFGPNGMVQSICQDDFAPAIDMIVKSMAKPLAEMCMPQRLVRAQDERVSCALYWELPTSAQLQELLLDANTPTECAALGELVDPALPVLQGDTGGQRCAIKQLPVQDGAADSGEGWYYDDFTSGLDTLCAQGLAQRVAFSEGARPPRGVAVKLECEAGASL